MKFESFALSEEFKFLVINILHSDDRVADSRLATRISWRRGSASVDEGKIAANDN